MPPSSQQAYQQLSDFNAKRIAPQQALSDAESRYGVGALDSQLKSLRTLTSNLESSINNVDPSVSGRTQGSLVTEAQRQRIVNSERDPLLKDYSTNMRSYGDVGDQYNRATGMANSYAQSVLGDQDNTYNRLFGQYNSLLEDERSKAAIAEQQRQFNAQMAAQRSQSLNLDALFKNAMGKANTAMASGPSQQQVNAALAAKQPNPYTPQPASSFYLPNQVGSSIGNALQFIPNAANAVGSFLGGWGGALGKKLAGH